MLKLLDFRVPVAAVLDRMYIMLFSNGLKNFGSGKLTKWNQTWTFSFRCGAVEEQWNGTPNKIVSSNQAKRGKKRKVDDDRLQTTLGDFFAGVSPPKKEKQSSVVDESNAENDVLVMHRDNGPFIPSIYLQHRVKKEKLFKKKFTRNFLLYFLLGPFKNNCWLWKVEKWTGQFINFGWRECFGATDVLSRSFFLQFV